jgi:hypothetical protein
VTAEEGATELNELALGKLTRILGPDRGRRVFDQTLAAVHLTAVRTPEELSVFAATLEKRGGIEAAVAGLLSVAATMRGASGTRTGT